MVEATLHYFSPKDSLVIDAYLNRENHSSIFLGKQYMPELAG